MAMLTMPAPAILNPYMGTASSPTTTAPPGYDIFPGPPAQQSPYQLMTQHVLSALIYGY